MNKRVWLVLAIAFVLGGVAQVAIQSFDMSATGAYLMGFGVGFTLCIIDDVLRRGR